jgi:hypothetical protein
MGHSIGARPHSRGAKLIGAGATMIALAGATIGIGNDQIFIRRCKAIDFSTSQQI